MSQRVSAVWVVLPMSALCLGGVIWLLSAIPAASDAPDAIAAAVPVGAEPGDDAPARLAPPPHRDRALPVREPPRAVQPVEVIPAAAMPAPVPADAVAHAGGPSADEALRQQATEAVRTQVVEQLQLRRAEVMNRCWPADAAADAKARLTLQLQVDGDGRELIRGVQEHRDAWVADFSRCFTEVSHAPFELDRTGANVSVDVVVDFP